MTKRENRETPTFADILAQVNRWIDCLQFRLDVLENRAADLLRSPDVPNERFHQRKVMVDGPIQSKSIWVLTHIPIRKDDSSNKYRSADNECRFCFVHSVLIVRDRNWQINDSSTEGG